MRYETNLQTGEVTEHEDAPATPEVPPTVQDQLNKLDADNALTQRNLRETVMLMAEAFKVVSNNAVDLSTILDIFHPCATSPILRRLARFFRSRCEGLLQLFLQKPHKVNP